MNKIATAVHRLVRSLMILLRRRLSEILHLELSLAGTSGHCPKLVQSLDEVSVELSAREAIAHAPDADEETGN